MAIFRPGALRWSGTGAADDGLACTPRTQLCDRNVAWAAACSPTRARAQSCATTLATALIAAYSKLRDPHHHLHRTVTTRSLTSASCTGRGTYKLHTIHTLSPLSHAVSDLGTGHAFLLRAIRCIRVAERTPCTHAVVLSRRCGGEQLPRAEPYVICRSMLDGQSCKPASKSATQ